MMPVVHKWIGNSPSERRELMFQSVIQVMDIWSLPGAQLKSINSFTLVTSFRLIIGHGE